MVDKRIIGIISDTHGLLRPEALKALEGSQHLIHAGDIGKPEILERLRKIAPVVAVRGNNDRGEWAEALPETHTIQLGETRLFVIHDLKSNPAVLKQGYKAVICGHSHRPLIADRDGTLVINPGSAGPLRFNLPVTVARLYLEISRNEVKVEAEIIELAV